MPHDINDKVIKVTTNQGNDNKDFILTVFFNGGPIVVVVNDGEKNQTYTFNADPFFRRNNHYIAAGSLVLRPLSVNNLIVTASFANMFPIDNNTQPAKVKYRLQLSAVPSGNRLVDLPADAEETIAPEKIQNVILNIQ